MAGNFSPFTLQCGHRLVRLPSIQVRKRSCMRPHYATNETLQEAVHLHLQTAEMEFCHHSVIFRLLVHWQKCICDDRILLISEAVPRLD